MARYHFHATALKRDESDEDMIWDKFCDNWNEAQELLRVFESDIRKDRNTNISIKSISTEEITHDFL